MKRVGNLWPRVVALENLLLAAKKALKGKRYTRAGARFWLNLEGEICRLQDELETNSYQPGGYRTFWISDPKRRMISAAPFRDRVVHHALCQVIEPVFEPAFIHDSYASRRGKGTHVALDRYQKYARRYRYVLKADLLKCFPSIDHEILKSLLARRIKDRRVLELASRIIEASNPQEPSCQWFPGDEDLLVSLARRRGLPIGNQTSQFFANVYLNPLDHFVKEELRAPAYLRYVDDFVLLHDHKSWLHDARAKISRFLISLRLKLHSRKTQLLRTRDGIRYLGFRVFPARRRLPRENVVKMRRRLKRLQKDYARGHVDAAQVRRHLVSWVGHAGHADTWNLRRQLFFETTFVRKP